MDQIDGGDSEIASFWDGMKGQQVIDAVRLSDVEGRWIDIPWPVAVRIWVVVGHEERECLPLEGEG